MRDFWCNSMSCFLSIHPYIFLFVRVSLANETFSFGSFEVLLQLTPCRLSLYGEFKNYVKFILLFFKKKDVSFCGMKFSCVDSFMFATYLPYHNELFDKTESIFFPF